MNDKKSLNTFYILENIWCNGFCKSAKNIKLANMITSPACCNLAVDPAAHVCTRQLNDVSTILFQITFKPSPLMYCTNSSEVKSAPS